MTNRWLLAATLVAGCGTEVDDRKPTSDVVVLEIMRPSCGQVQCHSSTTAAEGLVFDTIEDAKATISGPSSVGDVTKALDGNGRDRMPPDSPLQDADVQLIKDWMIAGMPDTLP